MPEISQRLSSSLVTIAIVLGGTIGIGPAWAQSTAQLPPAAAKTAGSSDELVEIVVTGTNIRGIQQTGSNVIDISQQDIQNQGAFSAADVLRDLPQVTNLGADASRNSPGAAQRAVANTVGGTGINLRGLGVEATLTLVDGYRVPGGGGEGRYFDPTSLPLIAMQRVDVVADGASAIYGSDAITGVVNLIPVSRFDGVEVSARQGWAQGLQQSVDSAMAGHSWSSGGFVVAFEHSEQSALAAADRPGQYPNSGATGAISNDSFPANLGNNPGPPPYNFVPGSTNHFVDSTNTGVLNAGNVGSSFGATPGTSGNWTGADALPEENRNTFYLHADQQISSAISVYGMGFVTQRDFSRETTGATTAGLTIPGLASGPYANAYNQTPAAVAASYNFINSLGNDENSGFERIWQARGGVKADLGHDWNMNLLASYGQTADYSATTGINNQALGAASSCNNPNVSAFAFPQQTVTTCNNPATAFDVFSNLKPGTPGFGYPSEAVYKSVLESITGKTFVQPTQNLTNIDLKFDGSLFALPGGDVKAAVGADYQHVYRSAFDGGNTTGPTNSDSVDIVYPNFSRQVESVFAEMYVPIVGKANAMPGIQSLLLDIAGRYDHYRDINQTIDDPEAPVAGSRKTFSTTNPKVSLTWAPIDDLKLRGSYGKSFRAPVPGDYSYGAPTLGIPFAVTPAVASLLKLPTTCATQPGSCYEIFNQGGTSTVEPETAKTWSFGADFAPLELPGFSASVTYYRIHYDNQIVVPGTGPWESSPSYAQALINDGLLVANPALGTLGTYNPSTVRGALSYGNGSSTNPAKQYAPYAGVPAYLFANGILPVGVLVNELNSNAGELFTQGFDYLINYHWNTSYGTWLLRDGGTFVVTYRQALAAGTPQVSYLNQINNPMHFTTRAQGGWGMGAFAANAYVNYVNAYENPGIGRVSSFTTVDLALSYTTQSESVWLRDIRFGLNATNLFDRAPPTTINIANQLNYDPQEASAIGRLVSLEVSKKF